VEARKTSGHLIAFEGLDQSGKQTQAERLLDAFRSAGHKAEFLTFPEYTTAIGEEIDRALQGKRDYQPDTLHISSPIDSSSGRASRRGSTPHDGGVRSLPASSIAMAKRKVSMRSG
jgi:hypothetical protein